MRLRIFVFLSKLVHAVNINGHACIFISLLLSESLYVVYFFLDKCTLLTFFCTYAYCLRGLQDRYSSSQAIDTWTSLVIFATISGLAFPACLYNQFWTNFLLILKYFVHSKVCHCTKLSFPISTHLQHPQLLVHFGVLGSWKTFNVRAMAMFAWKSLSCSLWNATCLSTRHFYR